MSREYTVRDLIDTHQGIAAGARLALEDWSDNPEEPQPRPREDLLDQALLHEATAAALRKSAEKNLEEFCPIHPAARNGNAGPSCIHPEPGLYVARPYVSTYVHGHPGYFVAEHRGGGHWTDASSRRIIGIRETLRVYGPLSIPKERRPLAKERRPLAPGDRMDTRPAVYPPVKLD